MINVIPSGNLVFKSQFFSSSGTFTVPNSVPFGQVYVTLLGAGGGGGDGATGSYGNNGTDGGGGILILRSPVTGLTPGASVTVTVGTGGAAKSAGGASSFGAYLSAGGGSAGVNGSSGGAGNVGGHGSNGGRGGVASQNATPGGAGGAGANGYCLVEWYERLAS